jgi:hypothetical protein
LLLAIPAGEVAGQATIRGVVRSDRGAPLIGAEIELRPSKLHARSTDEGRFAIGNIPVGTYVLAVRAVGYRPLEADAEISGPDTVVVTLELAPAVQMLETVHADAPAPTPVIAKMAGFEERRKAGFGRFLTRVELERREHSALSDVLGMVAGLRMVRRPTMCGDGYAAATGRSGALKWEAWMTCSGGAMPAACYLTLYVDGIRLWTWGQPDLPDLDKLLTVMTIEGIEIYRGPSETPIAYQATGSACGALLIWTPN